MKLLWNKKRKNLTHQRLKGREGEVSKTLFYMDFKINLYYNYKNRNTKFVVNMYISKSNIENYSNQRGM